MLITYIHAVYGEFEEEEMDGDGDITPDTRDVDVPDALWEKYIEAKGIYLELLSEIFGRYEDAE